MSVHLTTNYRLPISQWYQDIFALLVIALAWLKLVARLERFLDVNVGDEGAYMNMGINFWSQGLQVSSAAFYTPVYNAWYYLLSLFNSDRLSLFYVNSALLSLLLPIALYGVLRIYKTEVLPSLLISAYMLITPANLPLTPKPMHFAILLILLTLMSTRYFQTISVQLMVSALGILIAAYVRPELFFAAVVLAVAGVIVAGYQKGFFLHRYEYGMALVVIVLIATLLMRLGIPAVGVGSQRSFVAFGQHYAFNWTFLTGSALNPWNNWQIIVKEQFGDVDSISAAFRSNPSAMLTHIGFNAVRIVMFLPTMFVPYPTVITINNVYYLALQGICFFIVVGSYAFITASRWIPSSRVLFRERSVLLLTVGLCLLTNLASTLIVSPAFHYQVLPAIGIALVGTLLIGRAFSEKSASPRLMVAMGAIILLLTPAPGLTNSSNYIPERLTIDVLRQLPFEQAQEPLTLFREQWGGPSFYLPALRTVYPYNQNGGFLAFMEEQGVDMVLITPSIWLDKSITDDPEWQQFITTYPTLGYTTLQILGTDRTLIIRRELVPSTCLTSAPTPFGVACSTP
ncbi:hypothetical protein HC928_18155 [bacterium]|nr:hypothetical protein [bacterium]